MTESYQGLTGVVVAGEDRLQRDRKGPLRMMKMSCILTEVVVIIKLCTFITIHETGQLTRANVNVDKLCSVKLNFFFKKGQLIVSFLF